MPPPNDLAHQEHDTAGDPDAAAAPPEVPTASPSVVEEDDRAIRRQCRRVLSVTTLGLMLVLMTGTSVTVALPEMSAAFRVASSTADWFVVSFMLANTASILVFGRISDLIGRKRLYLGGLAVFTVVSLLCPLADNSTTMIVLRVLQGIAAATTVSNTTALIADSFPPHRLTFGLSMNVTAAAVAHTVGPAVGGVLITAFDWRAIFLMNVPFGIAAIVWGSRVLQKAPRRTGTREPFDLQGAVLSTAGMVSLLVAINRASTWGMADPRTLGLAAAGVALLGLFARTETRSPAPLVDLMLIRDAARACAYGAAFFNSLTRAGVTVLVVLHLQVTLQRTAAEAGLVLLAMGVATVAGSPVGSWLSRDWSARALSTTGSVVILAGLAGVLVTVAHPHAPLWATGGALAAVGWGVGLFAAPNTAAIMAGVDRDRRATASGVRAMLFNGGQAVGTAVTLLILNSWLARSGVETYAAGAGRDASSWGSLIALMLLMAANAASLALSILRGGPWRTPRRSSPVDAAGHPDVPGQAQ
ncbi:MAG: Drug resistance transporter, EmrB/QacA subfamily [Modestobacter sp.]|nr:Drug resistance transporter, EmrB/QacA subfamily [Modestobacter sp.]